MASAPEEHHQMQTPVNCDTCENTAKHLCQSCLDRLCDRCKEIHTKSKASFDHVIVLLTFESLTLSPECPSSYICKWHPKFRASIGCQKCNVPVCEKCLIGEHNGHNLIEFTQLFQYRKEKLEQKLSKVRSELPKYESELEKVRKRTREVPENTDIMKKEIDYHFESAISFLDASKQHMLKIVEEKTVANLCLLKEQENNLQTYIKNMLEYIDNIQNEDLQERISFILSGVCSTDDIIPERCPSFSSPRILTYVKGCLQKSLIHKISGDIFESHINTKLLKKEAIHVIKTVHLNQGQILSLCFDSGLYWVYSSNENTFKKHNEEGVCVDEIQVQLKQCINRPFCVVENEGVHAIYRNDTQKLCILKESQQKLFINFAPLGIACFCLTTDGDILVGLAHSKENIFGIARYSMCGERKQFITQIMRRWTLEPLLFGEWFRAYIVENINGDICLSVETNLSKVVNVIRPNGDHRFTYEGKGTSLYQPFLPRGICTNVLGHILIADENNHGIHVLDKDGGFLTMLTIPGEPHAIPITLCIDHQNNLCIGCADGKIRILKYLD